MVVSQAKILVVDDDCNLLELLVDTLKSIGYSVEGAPGGIEALEMLTREKYDLVVTDIKMPGMDGITLLKKIRRYHTDLPVLFITGVASDDVIGRASPDGFLAKPFRISHIEDLIENTLTNRTERVERPIRKVMVVDDDETFRDMLSENLKYNEYTPLAVADGEQALRELKNGEIDAVITDIKMPGMDGIDLLHKIKERYSDLPVVLITAFHSSANEDALDEADGFLQKPFDIDRIIALLDELSMTSAPD